MVTCATLLVPSRSWTIFILPITLHSSVYLFFVCPLTTATDTVLLAYQNNNRFAILPLNICTLNLIHLIHFPLSIHYSLVFFLPLSFLSLAWKTYTQLFDATLGTNLRVLMSASVCMCVCSVDNTGIQVKHRLCCMYKRRWTRGILFTLYRVCLVFGLNLSSSLFLNIFSWIDQVQVFLLLFVLHTFNQVRLIISSI